MREIVAIVLAAGLSARYGRANKLLADVAGEPMVRRVVQAVRDAGYSAIVVTGHEADAVEAAVGRSDGIRFAWNERFREGVGTSIRAGVLAAPEAEAWLVVPGDMPHLTKNSLAMANKVEGGSARLAAFRIGGKLSPPSLFGNQYFQELSRLSGDKGAKSVILAHQNRLVVLEADESEFRDYDTPHAALNLTGLGASRSPNILEQYAGDPHEQKRPSPEIGGEARHDKPHNEQPYHRGGGKASVFDEESP